MGRSIKNFSHHASFLKIKKAKGSSDCFSFKLIAIEDLYKQLLVLDASNATQSNEMATKIIKNNSDICSKFFEANLNSTIETSTFPEQLKYGEWNQFLKSIPELTRKTIDQSVFFLSYLIYEMRLNKQLEEYFQALLSKYQCDFRKGCA